MNIIGQNFLDCEDYPEEQVKETEKSMGFEKRDDRPDQDQSEAVSIEIWHQYGPDLYQNW